MYIIFEKNTYGSDKMVGYVETFEEFLEFCDMLGLVKYNETTYGEKCGAYYRNVHYVEKIGKAI
jgi:hypothetical protein